MQVQHYIKKIGQHNRFPHLNVPVRILSVCGLLAAVICAAFATFGVSSAHAACANPYTIVSGDTLSGIAGRFSTTVQSLANSNGIQNVDLIYAGQSLCVSSNAATNRVSVAAQSNNATTSDVTIGNNTSIDGMIDQVFGPYAAQAKQVAACESSLNPSATNTISIGGSYASGLFQILYPSTWSTTSQAGASPYNASANIVAAHDIFVRDGYSWREWVCQPW